MKCPNCESKFKNNACSNKSCVLSYRPQPELINWDRIWYKIFHSSIREIYYKIKIRVFKRYDRINTGFSKWHWCDKDYLILHGMMGLLVDYIEKENPFECVEWDDEFLIDGVKYKDAILALYIDWKVNYPKLEQKENAALTEWAKSTHLCMSDGSAHFEVSAGYTPDDVERLNDKYHNLEATRMEMEQLMLHKLIDIRCGMWT